MDNGWHFCGQGFCEEPAAELEAIADWIFASDHLF